MAGGKMNERLALTIPEAAKQLGISRTHAYAMAKRGEIPVVWFGGRCLVPVALLKERLLRSVTNSKDAECLVIDFTED
jgi:excisionase family DNA binding protein